METTMKAPFLILLTCLLTACAASTPQQAREMSTERRYVFQVDADYQTAYQRIVDQARKCHQYPVGTAMQMVQGDLYPAKQSGTITVGLYGAFGPSLYQVIDVRGLDATRSEVTATFPMGPVEKMGGKVKGWANGSGTEC